MWMCVQVFVSEALHAYELSVGHDHAHTARTLQFLADLQVRLQQVAVAGLMPRVCSLRARCSLHRHSPQRCVRRHAAPASKRIRPIQEKKPVEASREPNPCTPAWGPGGCPPELLWAFSTWLAVCMVVHACRPRRASMRRRRSCMPRRCPSTPRCTAPSMRSRRAPSWCVRACAAVHRGRGCCCAFRTYGGRQYACTHPHTRPT